MLTTFEAPTNWAQNMGQRVRGFVIPPVTGQYRFWIASDDEGRLILSTDNNPANGKIIATTPSWTNPDQWTKYPEQTSALITLTAGKPYYIEALMKQGTSLDNLGVAWQLPATSGQVVIAGQYLSPWIVNHAPVITNPGAQTNVIGNTVSYGVTATDSDLDPLTFSAVALPPGLSMSAITGRIAGTPTTAGTFNVTVSVTDNRSNPVTTSFAWTINPQLDLNPASPATTGAPGIALNYTITSTGGINPRFQWNWGDGTPDSSASSSPAASHSYASPGRYQITVTATDDTGRITTVTFYQAVAAPLTAARPTASSSIVYEQRSGGTNNRLWAVNQDNNSVSVFDAVTRSRLAEIAVGTAPRSLAVAPTGSVWVTNNESSTVSIINGSTFAVSQTIKLPRGSRPFGIAFSPDGSNGWIACEGTGLLLRMNATNGAIVATLPIGQDIRHVSVTGDSARVFVTRFITPPLPGENTAVISSSSTTGGEVYSVTTATLAIEKKTTLQHSDRADTITTGRGIPNYLGPAIISPDGLTAWVASKQDNIKRGILRDGNDLTHDQTIRSIASRIPLTNGSPDLVDDTNGRVDFDNAGIAVNAAFDAKGIYLFTALEGSREVGIVDVWNKKEVRRFSAGRAPQGIAVAPDGRTIFVQNFMDRTITVHDVGEIIDGSVATPVLIATLNCITTEQLAPNVLLGKKHFYDSADRRIAFEQYISCASCHNDGGQDGRVWDFTGFGEGLRNTITLRGHGGTAQGPVHWTGNFDEIQDFENQIHSLPAGTGLIAGGTPNPPLGAPNGGRSIDLDSLADFVAFLTHSDASPFKNEDGTLTASAQAGKLVFANNACANCHGGAQFTDSAINVFHDVGTITSATGQRLGGPLPGLDTPTLRGVFNTAPYLHDGSAATLAAAIVAHTKVPHPTAGTQALTDLVNYLSSIDDGEATPTPNNFAVTLTAPSTATAAYQVTGVSELINFTDLALADFAISNGTGSQLVSDASNGTFSLLITPNAAGQVTVQVQAGAIHHGSGASNNASNVATTVYTIPNRAPTMSTPATQSTLRGAAATLQMAATDPDGDRLTYSATGLPAGLSIDSTTGLITGTINTAAIDTYNSSVIVSDGILSTTISFTWHTTAPATTAVLSSDGSVITTQSFVVTLNLSAPVTNVANTDIQTTNCILQGISGSGTVWVLTLQPSSAGPITVRYVTANTSSNTLTMNFSPPAPFQAKINFQPVAAPVPNGYMADSGEVLGSHHGLTYGWSVDQTQQTRLRNTVSDQRQDTLILLNQGAHWEMVVPNGSYDVTVCVGDPTAASVNSLSVNGSPLWSQQRFGANVFSVKTVRVLVGDGHLTIDNSAPGNSLTRLDYIDIRAINAPVVADGTHGLVADYYSGVSFNQLRFSRIDEVIDYEWQLNTPEARMPRDQFSVRWHGFVVPRFSEAYTFTTTSDDGVRLWVNGQLIVDNWSDHAVTQNGGSITLAAGVPATIKMECYERGGYATARLEWQSTSQSREVVPNERLTTALNGGHTIPYPTTFAAWLASGRADGATVASDIDLDGITDLAEYALGTTASTGVQISKPISIENGANGDVIVSNTHPAGLTDVAYVLQGTNDLKSWTNETVAASMTTLGDGTERFVWTNPGHAILRLQIVHTSGATAVTTPAAMQRLTLNPGIQTVGISVNRPSVFAGAIAGVSDNTISLNDNASLLSAIDGDARYYLEIRDGVYAGHRFDVQSVTDTTVTIDTSSIRNTMATVPTNLEAAGVIIRPHTTLANAFDPDKMQGSNRQTTADRVLLFENEAYTTYWLYDGGSNPAKRAWLNAADASLTPYNDLIISPGAGVIVRIASGTRNWALAGQVRTNPFIKTLVGGHNFIASPWPTDQSPTSLGLVSTAYATGNRKQPLADQIQVWNGDTPGGSEGYFTYWLYDNGVGGRNWLSMADASLASMNDKPILLAHHSVFYKAQQGTATRTWIIPQPQ